MSKAQTLEIPPTETIRERLSQLVQESARTRKLLRLAQQRDKLLPPIETQASKQEASQCS